jgi:hypothetical protein
MSNEERGHSGSLSGHGNNLFYDVGLGYMTQFAWQAAF